MCHQDIFKPLTKICEILLKSQNLPIFLVLYIFFSVSTIKLKDFIHLIQKNNNFNDSLSLSLFSLIESD